MSIRPRSALPALLAATLLSACLSPTPWWEGALEEWEGAGVDELESAWGPPGRTILGTSGHPVYVYESHTTRDYREEILRDPSSILSGDSPPPTRQLEDLDCLMFFEIADGKVADTRYEGAGCEVLPRERGR